MKAISIRQPWLWAILNGGKRVENRSQRNGRMPPMCRHRGPLLLHASKWSPVLEFSDAIEGLIDLWIPESELVAEVAVRRRAPELLEDDSLDRWDPHPELARGGICGRAVVIGHLDPESRFWLDPDGREDEPEISARIDRRWHVFGSYALVLGDVKPLPFLECRGALGLFDIPAPVLQAVGA